MTEATAAPAAPAAAPAPAAPLSATALLAGDPPAAAPAAAPGDQTPAPGDNPPEAGDQAPALKLPGKDATPEEWAAFYNQLGRPETPEAYELPVPEGEDPAFAKAVAPMLHKHGLTAEQAKGLAADWNAMQAQAKAAYEQAETQRIQALDARNKVEDGELANEWGQQNDANRELAKRAARQFFGEHASDVLTAIEDKVGFKATLKMLAGIGKGLGEHDAAGLGEPAQQQNLTLAQRMYPNHR